MARIILLAGGSGVGVEEASFRERKEAFSRQGVLRVPGRDFHTWRHFHLDAGILPDSLQIPSAPSPGSQELGMVGVVSFL